MIQVYTGNGKGKTTCALGLALRAVGAGLKVYIAQFIKGRYYSEMEPHGFTAVVPEKPAAASRLPLGKTEGRRGPPPTCCGDISP